MWFKTISMPTSGGTGGTKGFPFSKNSMGDFTGSNLEGAHHLKPTPLELYDKGENALTYVSKHQIEENAFKNIIKPIKQLPV